tara:strand:+ start:1690 stop:2121 length:432 start_codon:yes stop_codon:yes gene_type:complete
MLTRRKILIGSIATAIATTAIPISASAQKGVSALIKVTVQDTDRATRIEAVCDAVYKEYLFEPLDTIIIEQMKRSIADKLKFVRYGDVVIYPNTYGSDVDTFKVDVYHQPGLDRQHEPGAPWTTTTVTIETHTIINACTRRAI